MDPLTKKGESTGPNGQDEIRLPHTSEAGDRQTWEIRSIVIDALMPEQTKHHEGGNVNSDKINKLRESPFET